MIAYHFPPFVGSSGVHRTLKLCRYLSEYGWRPVVLTVEPRAYEQQSEADLGEIPADVPVYRSFCLDAARDLAVRGRYPGLFALPDRWSSWWLTGVRQGLHAIRHWRPDAVWSTYPIATAHLIGGTLTRLTRLPWVADFRDWMTEGDYPAGRLKQAIYRRIERYVLTHSDAAVFTTESCHALYRQRYPALEHDGWSVLPNGYDEADFALAGQHQPRADDELRFVHSGHLYPQDRSPVALFEALATLRREGVLAGRKLSVVFRAPGDSDFVDREARRLGVDDIVQTAEAIPHDEAVAEMTSADGLLLLQGERFSRQIPAKAYEYLRSGRPVLTLAPEGSEAARLMRRTGWPYQAALDASDAIAQQLRCLLEDRDAGRLPVPEPTSFQRFDRRRQAGDLATILTDVSKARPAPGQVVPDPS